MNTNELKKFAQAARRQLMEQVEARLKLVLQRDSVEIREKEKAVRDLREQIAKTSKAAVIERVSYIWFNRFCALRFMDMNHYTKVGTVSPAEGFSQPEILQEAKHGHIDKDLPLKQQKIFDLLGPGKAVSADPQQEAYRLLVVAACNSYHKLMPFMFEWIADYTELLMPEDLLSENSILHAVQQALNEKNCQDVEVIGWLYQFYISEKKDQVFEGLKKNKKITPENIPAATQLFTPHWIVRYLVENSLGRLWMLNRPDSRLIEHMDYYIKPEEPETDFLKVKSPEEIKICDPACGSGHMLTYAFDLLYSIYEEEGYDQKKILNLILTRNLFGIEIDERAGALAAFALTMKACGKYRRFFRKPVLPNICVLENVEFNEGEIKNYMDEVGRDLFTMHLQSTLHQFGEANNFGSLIRPDETKVQNIYNRLKIKGIGNKLFLSNIHPKVLQVLKQADYLSPKYHVVVANPPYMGGKGMNERLGAWVKDNYPDSKSDLFAVFVERVMDIVSKGGVIGIMTPFTWMFLSSYEKLRSRILNENTITALVRPEYHAFFESAYVPICGFTLFRQALSDYRGAFVDLKSFYGADRQSVKTLEAIRNPNCGWFYRASSNDFKKVPSKPIAYWVSQRLRHVFQVGTRLGEMASPRQGLATGDNDRFVRCWHEMAISNICFDATTNEDAEQSGLKWFPYNKGGDYRKWFGNQSFVVNWARDGLEIRNFCGDNGRLRSRPQNTNYFFRISLSWSKITSGGFSLRYFPNGFVFDVAGCSIFVEENRLRKTILGVMNSPIMRDAINSLSPTLNFEVGHVANFPIVEQAVRSEDSTLEKIDAIINLTKNDWNFVENSWDFTSLPLLHPEYRKPTLKVTYTQLRTHWQEMTLEMVRLEEENNSIFIEAYGLQDELTPDVPLNEITLTCNPHYRYGGEKNEEKLEALLLADTMKELISYSVGCMFGRYSLDKPGLILANQGETVQDYLSQIPNPTFEPDDDNVIPILDGEWFIDDIAGRFRRFLKITFGEDHYEENLRFLEKAIGKDIRKYFLKDFYTNHVKRYKKRPIYWLFSSPKGGFNALIYMHRYRPDTVSIVLNDYLREFRTKLISRREHLEAISISASASKTEKTKALKEIEKLKKTIAELDDYERDTLYPLATQKIEIDLDDGVKVNYPKFAKALKKVPGLSK
ncbi:MAG: BREX-1 system adenine-specific DNA-methyltransferase PglX [Deltaproteobacteria bacterium]|nr:BREX-1 system adenine-specific DNA-methyltransferase PglX [Deltaproteobacteria bacterium]